MPPPDETGDVVGRLPSKLVKSFVTMFGVAYNLVVISVVETLLDYRYGSVSTLTLSELDGSILVGVIVGMVVIGYLGDTIGRSKAFVVTLALTLGGALACGFLPWGTESSVEHIIVAGRFFVGLGAGGAYPLAGVETMEEQGIGRAALVLGAQTIGFTAPYLLGFGASYLPHATDQAPLIDAQIHTLFLIGALPALSVLPSALTHEDSAEFRQTQRTSNLSVSEAWAMLSDGTPGNEYLRLRLVACMTCYFFYDMASYWIGLYSSTVWDAIYEGDSYRDTMLQNIAAAFSCIPAGLLSIYLLTTRRLSTSGGLVVGFLYMGASFAVMGMVWSNCTINWVIAVAFLNTRFSTWLLAVFGCFLLPVQIFPARCRSTFAGICNAAGKVGALVGVFVIPNTIDSDARKFALCAVTSLMSAGLGYVVLHPSDLRTGDTAVKPKHGDTAEPTERKPLLAESTPDGAEP